MKQTRTKGKDLLKVATVCILSIGFFCLAFAGFNHMIFASATNDTTPLPPATTTEAYTQNQEQLDVDVDTDAFTSPTFTLIEVVDLHAHSIPSSAISIEDAAEIGARYIWDVFGTSIDGLYMEVWFSAHASQSNTTWRGMVYMENPLNGELNEVYGYSILENSALPVYIFSIDSITGEREDITYIDQQRENQHEIRLVREVPYHEDYIELDTRTPLLDAGWFDMNIDEQVAFAGLSNEALYAYLQTAMTLAQAQFNTSNVSNVQLTSLATNGIIDGLVDVAALNFTAIDSNGREALIFIPATGADFIMISITTNHNDFIPGFNYAGVGGIG